MSASGTAYIGDMNADPGDIVDRLRASVTQARAVDRSELLEEAADEISRLRRLFATVAAIVDLEQMLRR